MKTKKSAVAARLTLMLVCGLVMAAPLLFMISRSFMTPAEVSALPPTFLPAGLNWENYVQAFAYLSPRTILNSFIVAIGIVLLQLLLALPVAFALALIPFRWSGTILAILIVPMFIPGNLTLIPTFVVTYQLGMLESYAGIIVPIAGQIAFAVILFRQFFASLPAGIVEAARIDGASWPRVFWWVTLPLAKPIIATYCSLTFLTAWNMYIWPQVVATDPDLAVINVALAPIAGASAYTYVSPAVGLAGATLGMLPALIVFLAMQKWYVRGIAAGSGLE
ncbi:carbohydrate ABC transporter permease [Microbacterium sp. MYb66]|jgi:ABC-type glycerol-3-phosphate transport system permease component|uniref:carbohydrate ABC transporter permease n=1 Tax=Microbacterium sp. MYb66 TaxID=1848692 RepID=UPI000CFF2E09|nr:carbohydrate ABC transporter permease [Microbacterium sp. MYb66]PRA78831.1 sugar ABC transporter permease [Microbacterium sp. MYb66]